MEIQLTQTEKEILEELKKLNEEYKFIIHECYRGYPAEYLTKEIDGESVTIEVNPGYARMEFCITMNFNQEEIKLIVIDSEDLQSFKNLLTNNNYFKNYLGNFNNEFIDLLVYKINSEKLFFGNHVNSLELELFFKGKKLNIELSQNLKDNLVKDFIKIYNGPKNLNSQPTILRIKGFSLNNSNLEEEEIRLLLNSVFFDIKCLRNEYFEVYNYHYLSENYKNNKSLFKKVKGNKHKLVFKNLIPELIDYFKVADQISYLPFKFLCYYHILEYFLDKSAHLAIKRKLDAVLYQPDFDANSNSYIDEILIAFKEEGDRLKSDKIKIQRVLQEFLDREKIVGFIKALELKEHFYCNQKFEFQTEVNLAPIKTDTDSQLFKTLADRIYAIRCSIVHSNPDFGVKKGVPFVSTSSNLLILEKEIFLLEEIARTLIIKSKIPAV